MLAITSTLLAANISLLTAPLQPAPSSSTPLQPGVAIPIQNCATIAADKLRWAVPSPTTDRLSSLVPPTR